MSQYDAFAHSFAETRSRPWRFVAEFVQSVFADIIRGKVAVSVDIGCGAGQYAPVVAPHSSVVVGVDLSWELLKTSKGRYPAVIQCDLQQLPIRNSAAQFALCVAVIHHVQGRDLRGRALREMLRILEVPGFLVLTAWRRWQPRFKKHFLREGLQNAGHYFPAGAADFGDLDVGWQKPGAGGRFPRLYHLFSQAEFRDLLRPFKVRKFALGGQKETKENLLACVEKNTPLILAGVALHGVKRGLD